jgi:magnesium-transporting ATPase (P-type)
MSSSLNKNGLSDEEVRDSIEKFGNNSLVFKQDRILFDVLKGIVLEPMFIILLITCIIYFSVGQTKEGIEKCFRVICFVISGNNCLPMYCFDVDWLGRNI